MKTIKKGLLLLTVLSPQLALANMPEVPKFYWHNSEGLKSAEHCKIIPLEESKFRISTYFGSGSSDTENIRNFNGVQQSYLPNGSLVKLVEGRERKNYEHIEVIGVNEAPNNKQNRWFSVRGDQGYLFNRSLLPIEDYIIKVTEDIKSNDYSIQSSYLRVSENGQYHALLCPEFEKDRDYLVFNGHKENSSKNADFYVAVYWDETDIFKSIETFEKSEAINLGLIPSLEEEDMDDSIDDSALSSDQFQEDMIATDNELISQELEVQSTQPPAEVIEGLNNIVCISSNTLNVRNEDLDKVIFSAKKGEKVNLFQDWESSTKTGVVNGESHEFIKVLFSERESQDQQIGWVVSSFIKPQSECMLIKTETFVRNNVNTKISGIDDEKCCEFPTIKKVTHSYTSGMRRFKANRGKGTRLHAACDLYRFKDEPIVSVAPGTVLRDRYFFYQGTYALEVVHSGGFVVRYGELTNKGVANVSKGKSVKMGDRLGFIGVVNSGCCRPMLHFELYKGNKTGTLSQKGNKYQRRSDLMDPTPYLLKWEDKTF